MKIRGNTIGTTIKPEKNLVKATNLTEAEKAQARENIGVTDEHINSLINAAINNLPVYDGSVTKGAV